MDWLYDDRTDCWSVLTTIPVREYLNLVRNAHAERGAITGQRDVLKTTTAKRIRDRMVGDIRQGAVLPPVVIGAVVSTAQFKKFPVKGARNVSDVIPDRSSKDIAIIDGMQRTAALFEAAEADKSVLDKSIRVEFWLAPSVRSMVYRMLVLNTGQVPWTLARQLSVVYAPLLHEIEDNVPGIDKMFTPDKPGRRVGPAQFGSDAIVELYIAFSLRKTTVDTREALSEEFSRLDFVENLSDRAFQDQFYTALDLLIDLDNSFARYDGKGEERFTKGRNVFSGQPARIGFIVALAQSVLGRPGLDRKPSERKARMEELSRACRRFSKELNELSQEKLGSFLIVITIKIDIGLIMCGSATSRALTRTVLAPL